MTMLTTLREQALQLSASEQRELGEDLLESTEITFSMLSPELQAEINLRIADSPAHPETLISKEDHQRFLVELRRKYA